MFSRRPTALTSSLSALFLLFPWVLVCRAFTPTDLIPLFFGHLSPPSCTQGFETCADKLMASFVFIRGYSPSAAKKRGNAYALIDLSQQNGQKQNEVQPPLQSLCGTCDFTGGNRVLGCCQYVIINTRNSLLCKVTDFPNQEMGQLAKGTFLVILFGSVHISLDMKKRPSGSEAALVWS